MTSYRSRHEILASLHELDQDQAEKVLDYIKGLLHTSKDEVSYQKFKREALKEIRQALGNTRTLKPSA